MKKEIKLNEKDRDDPLGNADDLLSQEIPPGVDRRSFLMRSAVVGAAAIMTGKSLLAADRTSEAVRSMPVIRPLCGSRLAQGGRLLALKLNWSPSGSLNVGWNS